jgi:hypothetical protein
MANHFKVRIAESVDTLKQLLKTQTTAQGKVTVRFSSGCLKLASSKSLTRPSIEPCATSLKRSLKCLALGARMPTNHSNKPIKNLPELIQVMTDHFTQGRPIRYFYSDESRWGLKTITGRVITAMGVKPLIRVQWPRETFWLYGAVELSSGESFFHSFSHLDTTCFNLFVQKFDAAFPDSLNLIQLDQAEAHCASLID